MCDLHPAGWALPHLRAMNTTKAALRQTMRATLRAMSPHERELASREICVRLLALWDAHSQWHARPVAVFEALLDEPQLNAFVTMLQARGVLVAAPTATPRETTHLDAFAPLLPPNTDIFKSYALDHNVFGLILVPGRAFDFNGARLGRGGGWYDRVLSRAAPDAFFVGVGFERQIVSQVPRETHDVLMHAIVTEAGVRETCRQRAY